MANAPVALNSSTINWRDPATTSPKPGRLQGDVKNYAYGGLQAVDNPTGLLGPNGEPLCGEAINLCGLTQTGPEPDSDQTVTGVSAPPDNYTNPLRISPDGCLWFDQNTQPYVLPLCEEVVYPTLSMSGPAGPTPLGPIMSLCWENETDGVCIVKRRIDVLNYVIDSPPPSIEAAGSVPLEVALPNYTVNGQTAETGEHTHPAEANNGGAGDNAHTHTVTVDPAGNHTHPITNVAATPNTVGTTAITSNQILNARSARAGVYIYLDIDGYHMHVGSANTNGSARGSQSYCLDTFVRDPGQTMAMNLTPMIAATVQPDPSQPYFAGVGIVRICFEVTCLPPGAVVQDLEKC